MRWLVPLLVIGCHHGLPSSDDDKTDDTTSDDTDVPGDSDTAVVSSRCVVTETEPNDAVDEAEVLPTESRACGLFQTTTDADYWQFTVPEEGWLAVDAPGFSLGSRANVSVTLAAAELDVAFASSLSGELPEVHVVFPAPAATWMALVRQSVSINAAPGSGEHYFYELRASITKPPITWDVTETANETQDAAQHLFTADDADVTTSVFASLDGPLDQDWFEIEVPGAGWALSFDVDAAVEGSAGDFSMRVIDEAGGDHLASDDANEVSPDPWASFTTTGPGVVKVHVTEELGGFGLPFWYKLTVRAEAP